MCDPSKNQSDRHNRVHPDAPFLLIIFEYHQKINRFNFDLLQLSTVFEMTIWVIFQPASNQFYARFGNPIAKTGGMVLISGIY